MTSIEITDEMVDLYFKGANAYAEQWIKEHVGMGESMPVKEIIKAGLRPVVEALTADLRLKCYESFDPEDFILGYGHGPTQFCIRVGPHSVHRSEEGSEWWKRDPSANR